MFDLNRIMPRNEERKLFLGNCLPNVENMTSVKYKAKKEKSHENTFQYIHAHCRARVNNLENT